MTTPRRIQAVAVAFAAVALLLPAAAGAAAIKPALQRIVGAGAPGAMALVDGRSTAVGVADVGTHRPLRADDRVRIGSLTKSFTAVVALQLVGEHRLRLN